MNFKAGLFQLREYIARGRCPFCFKFDALQKTPTLDGSTLYMCKHCKAHLLVPKELVKDA